GEESACPRCGRRWPSANVQPCPWPRTELVSERADIDVRTCASHAAYARVRMRGAGGEMASRWRCEGCGSTIIAPSEHVAVAMQAHSGQCERVASPAELSQAIAHDIERAWDDWERACLAEDLAM